MKIALLGGAFNPIHLGHLLIAQNALKSLDLDKVYFIPCAIPPHKADTELLPGYHRLAMIQLAIRDHPKFEASALEIERGGVSYSVDTLRAMHKQHSGSTFFLMTGSDNFQDIGQWNRFSELVHQCEFLVMERPGHHLNMPTMPSELAPFFHYQMMKGPVLSVSSSEIRKRIREKKSVSHLIPIQVYEYIQNHSLYS